MTRSEQHGRSPKVCDGAGLAMVLAPDEVLARDGADVIRIIELRGWALWRRSGFEAI